MIDNKSGNQSGQDKWFMSFQSYKKRQAKTPIFWVMFIQYIRQVSVDHLCLGGFDKRFSRNFLQVIFRENIILL